MVMPAISFNPKDWLKDILNSLSDMLQDAFKSALKSAINVMFQSALPTPKAMESDWLLTSAGGTLGLAFDIWRLSVVVIGFFVLLNSLKRSSSEMRMRVSRLLTSMTMLGVFSLGFYPLYSLAYNIEQGSLKGMLSWMTGTKDGNSAAAKLLADAIMPQNILGKIAMALIIAIFMLIVMYEFTAMTVALFVLIIFYPLTIALRTVGNFGTKLFNGATAGIFVVLFSPPPMIFLIFLPIMIGKIPGLGLLGNFQSGAALVCGLAACIVPVVLAMVFYKKTSEIFGNADVSIADSLDIGSMPPVTVDDMSRDVQQTSESATSTFAKEMAAGTAAAYLGNDDVSLFDSAKSASIDATAAVATFTGYPMIGAAISATNNKKPGSDK